MSDCIFCKIINKELPCHKIYEDENTIAFLDINPANLGHTLIIPKRHCSNFSELTDKEASDLAIISKKILSAILNSEILSQGANLVMNQGAVAGQEVFHFHWHLIPRHDSDLLGIAFNRSVAENTSENLSKIAHQINTYIN